MAEERLGRYRLVAELGFGAMGIVYLAEPDGTDATPVAIKVLRPGLAVSDAIRERFLREAEIGRRIRHPNVVRTIEAGSARHQGSDALYLVMEYVAGQSLRVLLREMGQVPERLCRHIGREVAAGLAAIHSAGAVHRDLKPENVLITDDHTVKVMDFGLAYVRAAAARLSTTGAFVGTPQYAAPEQFLGEDPDGRADLYALGLILYELATGHHPFGALDPAAAMHRHLTEDPRPAGDVNPQLSPFLEEVLNVLLARDREARFGSAAEVAGVLEEGEDSPWWGRRATAIRGATHRPLRRIRLPRETTLHGRREELLRLRALFAEAKAGRGHVVLIEGEAGVGKTRLLDEFVHSLEIDGEAIEFLFGGFPPGPATAFATALVDAFRHRFGDERIEEALARHLRSTPGLLPGFAALLRGEPGPAGGSPLDRDALRAVFVRVAQSLAGERPTIVAVEDLHFAPPEGVDLFAALALAAADHRLLVVGTSRAHVAAPWAAALEQRRGLSRLDLARLGPADVQALLAEAFGSPELAGDLAGDIAEKSDGNPFFVFEILRSLREARSLTQTHDGHWVRTRIGAGIAIPSSVLELVRLRLSELQEQDRELLDTAACAGFRFDPTLVAEALQAPRIAVLKRLAAIERRHRLVRSAGLAFVFDHHQIQDVLHGELPEALRREYHAALGGALARRSEARGQPAGGTLAVELSRHFLLGGRGPEALATLDAALDHLDGQYANAAAIDLSEQALAVHGLLVGERRANVLLRRALWLGVVGRAAEVRPVLDEAVAEADGTGDAALRARARTARARDLGRIGRQEDARADLEEAIRLAHAAADRHEEGMAVGTLGSILMHLGRYEEAAARFERHVALARETGDRAGEARALGALGTIESRRGDRQKALAYDLRYLEICREIHDRRLEATATGNLGVVLFDLGRYDEARAHYERHLALAHEVGDREGEARATGNLGALAQTLGRHEEALAYAGRYLARCREIGYRRGEGIAQINHGQCFVLLGNPAGARPHFEEALRIARELKHPDLEGSAIEGLGDVAAKEGDAGEARARYEEALAIWQRIKSQADEARTRASLASLVP